MANILVYALHYDGAINKNSLGAVSEGAKLAAELGGEAHAILLGENVPQDLAASLGNYGAKKVLVAEGPEGLAQPLVDAMAEGDHRRRLLLRAVRRRPARLRDRRRPRRAARRRRGRWRSPPCAPRTAS